MLLVVIFTIILSLVFMVLWLREKRGIFVIRIGKRGSSVLAAEMELNNGGDFVAGIIEHILSLREYRYYLVCSGVSERAPNRTISEKEYFFGKIAREEALDIKPKEKFNDLSLFILNEEIDGTDKILLTHDLIVNSAQIPDRELLLESGFIITLIKESNLIVITGVREEFEKVIFNVSERLFTKNRRVVFVKM